MSKQIVIKLEKCFMFRKHPRTSLNKIMLSQPVVSLNQDLKKDSSEK